MNVDIRLRAVEIAVQLNPQAGMQCDGLGLVLREASRIEAYISNGQWQGPNSVTVSSPLRVAVGGTSTSTSPGTS